MTPILSYFLVGLMIVMLDFFWHRSKWLLFRTKHFTLNAKSIGNIIIMILLNGSLCAAVIMASRSLLSK